MSPVGAEISSLNNKDVVPVGSRVTERSGVSAESKSGEAGTSVGGEGSGVSNGVAVPIKSPNSETMGSASIPSALI